MGRRIIVCDGAEAARLWSRIGAGSDEDLTWVPREKEPRARPPGFHALSGGLSAEAIARLEPRAGVGADPEILGATLDSRRVERGDVFFAIRGLEQDGETFAPEAIRRGARAVVAASPRPDWVGSPMLPSPGSYSSTVLNGTSAPPRPRGSVITSCSGAQSPEMFGSPFASRAGRAAAESSGFSIWP